MEINHNETSTNFTKYSYKIDGNAEIALIAEMALIWVCKNKMSDIALKLLDSPNLDCNKTDENGETALIWACKNKMSDIASKLLDLPNIDYNE